MGILDLAPSAVNPLCSLLLFSEEMAILGVVSKEGGVELRVVALACFYWMIFLLFFF